VPASMSPPVQAVRSDPHQRATRQLAAAVVAAGWLTGWARAVAGQPPTVLVSRVAGPIAPLVAEQWAPAKSARPPCAASSARSTWTSC
jgi:hypothetical protein